ncbi:hypothetical protein [Sphingomonas quercus]|uniref:Uncharacterized protein n=1 Tax=Sphingomonas quercus TaxID=2842451 RepID=A0ABS6BFR5_9SPHN|nr:hypothetical protein [Sphingomonas quercus]MBU3077132.1 hypothetical protein [Sphingomonas quercus]
MKSGTPYPTPSARRDAATPIAVPRPMQDGVGRALNAAYPAPRDEISRDLAVLLERLH